MNTPIAYIKDTPTLENAMSRVSRQFILDGHELISVQPVGGGKFRVETDSNIFAYEWSHVNGTRMRVQA